MSQNLDERSRVSISPPRGLDEICLVFGDISQYILPDHSLDPRWQSEFLTRITLPFALPLSWDKSRAVDHISCHKLVGDIFEEVFGQLYNSGLYRKLTSFGGCFAFRPQRTGTKLSTHAWGIAIDLNPETNQQGTAGDFDPEAVAVFAQAGFEWGGNWARPTRDPMHFQFCTGY